MNNNPFEAPILSNSKSSLSGRYKKSWIESSFFNGEPSQNKNSAPITKNFLGNAISPKKASLLLIICLGLFVIILSRILYLQTIKGNEYLLLAEQNRVRIKPIPSERGIFYDRFNKELVINIPNFTLAIVPNDLPRDQNKRQEVITKISAHSGLSYTEIQDLINKFNDYGYDSLILKENLDYNTAIKLYIVNADLPGVLIESGSKRLYTYATSTPSASHLLGYLGKLNKAELQKKRKQGYLLSDKIGKTGLEKYYEEILRGTYGRKKIEINSNGKEQNILSVEAPVAGNNLVLSIDIEAQMYLEKLVKNAAARLNKQRIAAVAINPNTGEILSLVSWPAYNANDFASGASSSVYEAYNTDPNQPLFNRAISGLYPPGSTIKPVIAAGGLEEGIITQNTQINSVGGFWLGDHFFTDWKAGGHGLTNVNKALAWSINTFFYYVGGGHNNFVGLGIQKLVKYLNIFKMGQATGIDLPGEKDGLIPTPEWKREVKNEPWYIGDTYNMSIGQGNILVTPMQVAIWTAAIANGGAVIKPRLVHSIINPVTKNVTQIQTQIVSKQTVSPKTISIVKQGMNDCVNYGSCQLLKTLPFNSGAKTGTAQWNNNKNTHAWFTAFAPYNNPQIVITVLIEEGGEGGIVSIPIARDFLAWWSKKFYNPKI